MVKDPVATPQPLPFCESITKSREIVYLDARGLNIALSDARSTQIWEQLETIYASRQTGTLSEEEWEAKKDALKKQFPVVMPNCKSFTDDHRCDASAVIGSNSWVDYDHLREACGLSPQELFEQRIRGHEKEWGLGFVEVTPSQDGIRIIARAKRGESLHNFSLRMDGLIGLEHDAAAEKISQPFYLCPQPAVLYRDDTVLFNDPDNLSATRPVGRPETQTSTTPILPSETSSTTVIQTDGRTYPDNYKGITFTQINKRWAELNYGGEPVEGERNTSLSKYLFQLRAICDNNASWLYQVAPRWGLPEEEVKKICVSATQKPLCGTPHKLTNVLNGLLREAGQKEAEPEAPALPADKDLPPLVRKLLKFVPEKARESCVVGMFPALATYVCGDVRVVVNISEQPCACYSAVTGDSNAGKSFSKQLNEGILYPLRAGEDAARQEEQQWRDRHKTTEARPGIVKRLLSIDMTPAALSRAMWDNDAAGKLPAYTCVEEAEDLMNSDLGKKIYATLRLAYDQARGGQERVSQDAVSVQTNIRWNLLVTGTSDQILLILGGERTARGNLRRFAIAEVPPREDGVLGDNARAVHAEEVAKVVAEAVNRLSSLHGIQNFGKRQRETHKKLHELAWADKEDYGNKLYSAFYIPAITDVMRRAYIIAMAEGKWSRQVENLALWMFKYDMYMKMKYFSGEYEKVAQAVVTLKPRKATDALKENFTWADYLLVRKQIGQKGDCEAARDALRKLIKRGTVSITSGSFEEIEKATFSKR